MDTRADYLRKAFSGQAWDCARDNFGPANSTWARDGSPLRGRLIREKILRIQCPRGINAIHASPMDDWFDTRRVSMTRLSDHMRLNITLFWSAHESIQSTREFSWILLMFSISSRSPG